MNFETLYQRIDTSLENLLNQCDDTASVLDALRYSTLSGGKRLRPKLVYATAYALTQENFASYANNADQAALACECMHCYSLIHDDLPAMDDDDWRRGKLTCHKQFDEATAILAGDALHAIAFDVLSQPMAHITAKQQLAMVALLAKAVGPNGMVGGQALDMASGAATLADLQHMHHLKTGLLFKTAVGLGARCVGCEDVDTLAALDTFATTLGLAYQIQDDILDITQTTKTLGKTQYADQAQNKCTFVSILGLSTAHSHLETTYLHARQTLTQLASTLLDVTPLVNLLDQIIKRDY